MIGKYKTCLIVFPKTSCYTYKDGDTKRLISENINKWLSHIKVLEGKCKYVSFAEDTLQRDISNNSSLVYVLGNGDINFISNNMTDEFSDDYVERFPTEDKIDESIIRESINKVHAPNSRECFDITEWRTKRRNAVWQRIRYACNEYMKHQGFILYFKARGNNFCNSCIDGTLLGDCRLIIEVDVYTGKVNIKYSGVTISELELLTILGG